MDIMPASSEMMDSGQKICGNLLQVVALVFMEPEHT